MLKVTTACMFSLELWYFFRNAHFTCWNKSSG